MTIDSGEIAGVDALLNRASRFHYLVFSISVPLHACFRPVLLSNMSCIGVAPSMASRSVRALAGEQKAYPQVEVGVRPPH